MNKNGKQRIGRNKFFKNKNAFKVSLIVDELKMPFSVHIDKGNINDAKLGLINLSKLYKCVKMFNFKNKPYILGKQAKPVTLQPFRLLR